MIRLTDLLKEGKVVITTKDKNAKVPSEYIDFTFRSMFRLTKFGGNNPQILCIPASSKELDKLDNLGDLNKDEVSKQIAKFYSKKLKLDFYGVPYRDNDQFTIALNMETILKKMK